MCILVENTPREYNVEFRSTPVYGNFNVLQLAASHRGGEHYNASGCAVKVKYGNYMSNFNQYL